jgi:prophage antirepressor-like protein
MKQLQKVFEYSGVTVRTQVVENEPWFCLSDLGEVLQVKNPRHFTQSEWCDKDGVRNSYITDALGREQETAFISEANLYAMVMRSTKKEAKEFSRWITHEVLPELRKTGTYVVENSKPAISAETDPILAQLQVLQDMRQSQLSTVSRVDNIEERVKRLENRQEFAATNMLSLPEPSSNEDLNERNSCRRLVEWLAPLTGMGFPAIWREAYRQYEMQTRVNLAARCKKAKMDKIEWIEKHGDIGVLHTILRRMHVKARQERADQAS